MTKDFDKQWRSWQLIVLRMTSHVTGMPSLPATHQVISLGPEGECHVITSRVSCHVIFATACHNSGGAALVMVFITVCKQENFNILHGLSVENYGICRRCRLQGEELDRRLRVFIYTITHFVDFIMLIISQSPIFGC